MTHYYFAYALNIQASFEFPELTPVNPPNAPCDVFIQWGNVSPNGLSHATKKGLSFQVNEREFWLSVANVARFLVRDGREIFVDPINNCDEDSIRVFLLGSCLGALLMQRGFFLLHGNVVQVNDGAVVFAGCSGAGKSTLAGSLYKRGFALLADDICAIDAHGQCIPGFPQLKLWADTAKQLDINTTDLRKIRPNIEKYALPLKEQFYAKHLPLKSIYILNTHNQENIHFAPLTGAAKYTALRSQAYRPQFLKGIFQEKDLQLRYAKLAQQWGITRVSRPNAGFTLHELTQRMESDWAKQGIQHG